MKDRLLIKPLLCLLSATLCLSCNEAHSRKAQKPNIVVIIADDMGRNDVSFHGSNQIPTPNIDALAYNGIILDRHYTQSICTPSRTAFLTGNYPIRSGMQGFPIRGGENRTIPLEMTLLPSWLKKRGYKTHLVGKWHLGAAYRNYTPTERGFDSHFGYWYGFIGYFDHFATEVVSDELTLNGLDLVDGFKSQWSYQGKYTTEMLTEKSLKIIDDHDARDPLFLVLAHLAPHAGLDGVELGVPNITETNIKFGYIADPQRRRYADIVSHLDESVGKVVERLSRKNLLENSIILFISDNGAQTTGLFKNYGSGWPLRGLKFTEFEGGVRNTAAIYSPLFRKTGYVNRQLIHITDWLPTFYRATGGNVADLGQIDGIDQWNTLTKGQRGARSEILTNINEVYGYSGLIVEKNNRLFKLVNGTLPSVPDIDYQQYYGEDGRGPEVPEYNLTAILQSPTNLVIDKHLDRDVIERLRKSIDLASCRGRDFTPYLICSPEPCLFDLRLDPCETTNIIKQEPAITETLLDILKDFRNQLVGQTNRAPDPRSNPIYYNNTWCTWLDDAKCVKTQATV